MKKNILAALCAPLLLAFGCSTTEQADNHPQRVILETDMGNDVDDALALDMVYKYHEAEKIDLLAIMSNKNGEPSAKLIDIMNTWYGHPAIPIGIVRDGSDCEQDAKNYAQAVCELKTPNSEPMFATSLSDYTSLPDAHILYRKILAQQPDSSVVIISIGFSTNLARLLNTPPDEYSPLTGKELIAKKVKMFSLMAGCFTEQRFPEYNVVKDIKAAQQLFAESPVPIVTSPFEVGVSICYPATSIENDFAWAGNHPMVEAYKAYLPMPYDRPTWDLTSVLYVAEKDSTYMGESPSGTITIDSLGRSYFEPDANGLHKFLTVTEQQAEAIKKHFVELISSKPKNR